LEWNNHVLNLKFLAKCPAGSYSPSGLDLPKRKCTLCPKGTYSYLEGSKECTFCPRQSTTDKDGSTLETDCKGRVFVLCFHEKSNRCTNNFVYSLDMNHIK